MSTTAIPCTHLNAIRVTTTEAAKIWRFSAWKTSLLPLAAMPLRPVRSSITRRNVEYALLPWCRERSIPIMAYSPIEQGRLLRNSELHTIAARHHVTPAQIALAWLLRQHDVIAIPMAGNQSRFRENRAALDLQLSQQDLSELDHAFPLPTRPVALETL
jgi:diketogulonate reductase-like aldo/keto reductase